MQAKVYNLAGEEVRSIELADAIFGITPNMAVVHQAVLRQQANARQGTANTKTRAHVSGGGRKPWRQKGTGRARQGSTRSPQWAHGGVVFGPHTRSYEQALPRKMRRLAIRSVLSAKAADGQLVLVDGFAGMEPRTHHMADTLKKLNMGEKSALIFTTGEENLIAAASNLPRVKTLSAHLLSVVDMLKYDYLVMPLASLDVVTGILGTHGGRTQRPLDGIEEGMEAYSTPVDSAEPAQASVSTSATATRIRPANRTTDAPPAATDTLVFAPTAQVQETADDINTTDTTLQSTPLDASSSDVDQETEAILEGDNGTDADADRTEA